VLPSEPGSSASVDAPEQPAPEEVTGPPSASTGPGFSLRSLARSAIILAGGTAAAQVVAIVRELYVAAQVGISADYDAVLIAQVVPMTLAVLITSGVVTALVPAYIAAQRDHGMAAAGRLAGAVLTWFGIATLAGSLVLVPLSDLLVGLFGPGLSPASQATASGYLVTLAPLVFVIGVSSILSSVCQAREMFPTIARATVTGPVVALAVTFLLWERMGIGALVLGTLVGPIVTGLMLALGAWRAGIAPRPGLRAPGLGLGLLVRHAAPLTVGASVMQLTVLADRAIASLIAPGAVSALRYAEVLVRLPIGAIGPAWGNAVYPALARAAHATGVDGLGSATTRLLRLAVVVFTPVAALTMAVAPVAVGITYGRGAFTPEDLALTSIVVVAFAPLIVLLMANPVVVDSLNARRRGTVLLMGAVSSAVLNFVLDVALGLTLGIAGIALATSLTIGTVLVLVLGRNLSRSDPDFRLAAVGRPLLAALVASTPAALVFGILSWGGIAPREGIPAIAYLGVAGTLGMASYLVLAIRLGIEEPIRMLRAVRARLTRQGAGAGV
jgi:putative peptidoglycan lipid II flippase